MPLQSSMARVFNTRELLFSIFDYLSLKDLRKYGLLSKAAYNAVRDLFDTYYKIKRVLGMFFPEGSIPPFQQLQHVTGTLIGGSVALQYFTRLEYSKSDLDLYVHALFADKLVEGLAGLGCVQIKPEEKDEEAALKLLHLQTQYTSPSIVDIIDFASPTGRNVQVIVTGTRPVTAILQYHSTTVMNFLSSEYAYSLYGRETLQEGLSLYSRSVTLRTTRHAKAKYERRGWLTVANELEAQAKEVFAPGSRAVGDEDTWIMRLGPSGAGDATIRDATWDLMYNLSGEGHIFPS